MSYEKLQLRHIARLEFAVVTLGDLKLHRGSLIKGLIAIHLNFRPMDKQILSAFLGDEAVAFFRVKPLHSTLRHFESFFLSLQNISWRGNAACRMAAARTLTSRARDHYTLSIKRNALLSNIT